MENNRRDDQVYVNGKPLNRKDEPNHESRRLHIVILLCTIVLLLSQICVVVSVQKVRDAEATIDQMSMTIVNQKRQIEYLENRLADTGSGLEEINADSSAKPSSPKGDNPKKPNRPVASDYLKDPGKAPSKNMEPNDDHGPGEMKVPSPPRHDEGPSPGPSSNVIN